MSPIRVMIVDDHSLLRRGLRLMLESQPDLIVVAEAADAEEALRCIVVARPDVISVDLSLGTDDGFELIPCLLKACPSAKILALTMHDDSAYARQAMAAGAAGYVVKSVADVEVVAAIHGIHQGRSVIHMNSPSERTYDLGSQSNSDEQTEVSQQLNQLSGREREVLQGVAQGYTSAQIGERLLLSCKTIETYRARLMKKLGISDRVALVRFATAAGLLDPVEAR